MCDITIQYNDWKVIYNKYGDIEDIEVYTTNSKTTEKRVEEEIKLNKV